MKNLKSIAYGAYLFMSYLGVFMLGGYVTTTFIHHKSVDIINWVLTGSYAIYFIISAWRWRKK